MFLCGFNEEVRVVVVVLILVFRMVYNELKNVGEIYVDEIIINYKIWIVDLVEEKEIKVIFVLFWKIGEIFDILMNCMIVK